MLPFYFLSWHAYFQKYIPHKHQSPEWRDNQMIETVRKALVGSYSAINQAQIDEVTAVLRKCAGHPGYVTALVGVAMDDNTDKKVTMAALGQLKNVLREAWTRSINNYQDEGRVRIHTEDQQYLVRNIMLLNTKLSDDYSYAKLVKDIIQIICYSCIYQLETILQMILQGNQLRTCLIFLLGLVPAFKEYMTPKHANSTHVQKIYRIFETLTVTFERGAAYLQNLHSSLVNNPTPQSLADYNNQKHYFDQLLYLAMKFMSKSLWSHMPNPMRERCCSWATMALVRVGSNEAEYESGEMGQKGSTSFNYFHMKKWSAKYLTRFVNEVMNYNVQYRKITAQYYNTYGEQIKEMVRQSFVPNLPTQLTYHLLSLVDALFQSKPQLMSDELHKYQFDILPRYIIMSREEEVKAFESPIDFVFEQMDSCKQRTVRQKATQIWQSLAKARYSEPGHQPVDNLVLSLTRIMEMIKLDGPVQKMGLFLLLTISNELKRHPSFEPILSTLIPRLLPRLLLQSDHFLVVRGYQTFNQFHRYVNAADLETITECVLRGMSDAMPDLIRIKAGCALSLVLNMGCVNLHEADWKALNMITIDLYQRFNLEALASSMKSTLTNMKSQSSVDYMQVFDIFVTQIYGIVANPDPSEHEYNAICELFDFVKVLIAQMRSVAAQLKKKIEKQLGNLLVYLWVNENQQTPGSYFPQIYKNTVGLISAYLNSQTATPHQISHEYWFFLTCFIVRLTGLGPTPRKILINNGVEINESVKQMLLDSGYSIESERDELELWFGLFRNYLKVMPVEEIKVVDLATISKNFLSLQPLQQLFYLLLKPYQAKDKSQTTAVFYNRVLAGRLLSCALLTSLLQMRGRNVDVSVLEMTLRVIKSNINIEAVSAHMWKRNVQLFMVWVWACEEQILSGKLEKYVNYIKNLAQVMIRVGEENLKTLSLLEERERMVLGLTSLIKIGIVHEEAVGFIDWSTLWIFFYTKVQEDDEEQDTFEVVYEDVPQATQLQMRNSVIEINSRFEEDSQVYMNQDFRQSGRSQRQELEDEFRLCHFDELVPDEDVDIRPVTPLMYFLDTLLIFRQNDKERYFRFIGDHHQYELQSLVGRQWVDLRLKYYSLYLHYDSQNNPIDD